VTAKRPAVRILRSLPEMPPLLQGKRGFHCQAQE